MLLKDKTLVQEVKTKSFLRQEIVKSWTKNFPDGLDKIEAVTTMASHTSSIEGIHSFTKAAMLMCDKIKVSDKDILYLTSKSFNITIHTGRTEFFRGWTKENKLYIARFCIQDTPEGSRMSYDLTWYKNIDNALKCGAEGYGELFATFLKQLVYLAATKEDFVILDENEKTKVDGEKFKNETKNPFIIVNSRWNTTTIKSGGFGVRGHFRMQPCGKKSLERKLIFIESFKKEGLVRKAHSIR